jgi:hypothetical protein
MADNFGSEQNRVLSVADRNIDNVVFQYKHPPLTSEWNLINQIGNEKVQNLAKVSLPSGWLYPNEILQSTLETDARTGCIICSESYDANTFKLVSLNNNIAVVNGWPILVQGTESSDSNNVIRLDAPSGQLYNFVFLEVWRKLVGTDDDIYPYGNVLTYPYSDNEIEWNVVGCETTKRVQIQYRIRHVRVSSSLIDVTKEIFDLINISPIGGRTTGEATFQTFEKFGSSDPGLYIAGDGSESNKEYLNTVDGYVYAIPMCIVSRRILSSMEFSATRINETKVTKEMMIEGYRSDRPDNKVSDIIYKDDIVDLRHKIITSSDLKCLVDETISKLLAGDLTTTLKKGADENGSITNACSGGNTLIKIERVNSPGGDNIPDIGVGSDVASSTFKRRAFCNAEIVHDHNIVEITNGGAVWVAGSFTIASKVTLPDGEFPDSNKIYFYSDQGLVTGVTTDGVSITIANEGLYPITGTSNRLFMEFTYKYYSSSNGFKDIPKEFLGITKNDTVTIATRDNDALLKHNISGELLNFGASSGESGFPGNPGDPTYISDIDFLRYCGGNYTELSNFGHELVLYRTTSGSDTITISLDANSKFGQHYILGVKAVYQSVSEELVPVIFTVERLVTTSPYAVTDYIITASGYSNKALVIVLYTGSKFLQNSGDSYSVADSVKFFELSKQGRGIIDTYELIEVIATYDSPGIYKIDTGDKPIIKLATSMASGVVGSFGYYATGANTETQAVFVSDPAINRSLPIISGDSYTEDMLPTVMYVSVSSSYPTIRVPVLVHSYVTNTEAPYNFYYKTVPYQGMLNTTGDAIYGKVVEEGPGVITTLGSGGIVNYTYAIGTVSFVSGTPAVVGNSTEWVAYVASGDYIAIGGSARSYRILSVESDTGLTLAENYAEDSISSAVYQIIRLDVADSVISNVVDRLPALSVVSSGDITDYKCYSNPLTSGSDNGDLIMTSPKRKLQDPLNALTNDFILGSDTTAKRGRNNFKLTISGNAIYKVGEGRPYVAYNDVSILADPMHKKVYQFYLFIRSGKGYMENNPDLMGKVYLMVVAGETVDYEKNILNPFFDRDVVDIFELVGRPIIRG